MGTVVSNKVNMVKSCQLNKVYKYYFTIINGLIGLTNKEIDIVSRLYFHNNDISKSVTDLKLAGLLLFSKEYKNKIIKELDIKPLLLNNYISSLKKKNIILVDGKDDANINYLNPKHVLDISKDSVEISFTLNIEEDKKVFDALEQTDIEAVKEEIEEAYTEEEVETPQATIEEVEETLEAPKKKRKKKAKEVKVPANFNPDKPW